MPRVVNPLPQLIPQRLAATRRGVAQLLWERVTPLAVWGGPVNATPLRVGDAATQELRPVLPGEHFGPPHGGWQQRWFRVELPAAVEGEGGRRHLAWARDGETTVYVDGRPWAGLDTHHPTCPLPDQATTLWLDCSHQETQYTAIFSDISRRECISDSVGASVGWPVWLLALVRELPDHRVCVCVN